MSATGTPIFNSLALARVEIEFTGQSLVMKAVAVFVNDETGMSHGSTSASGQEWSQETIRLLAELKQSMEDDIAKKHFVQGSARARPGLQAPGGLGEHLTDDAPSV